jgi:MinD-like ATPase involved in chromosome partitioning or flagellar assembly/CheY-like chemotaxis protein
VEKRLAKVLLIEDNPGDARLMREYLAQSDNPYFTVELAPQLSKGLERLERGGIDAVLLDLRLPDSDGLETFTAVRGRAPGVPIVVLTGIDDEELAERAVREGAQDYLVKGRVDDAQLTRALRYAMARQEALAEKAAAKPGKVIGVMGAKGGVGTTTVALNVATALARRNLPAALLELHSCRGSLSDQLHTTPAGNLRHLLELDPAGITPTELAARLCKLPSGLRVLFSPQQVGEFVDIPPESAKAILQAARAEADYLIVELPCGAALANRVTAQSCDYIGLVLEPEPLCARAARTAVQLLESWGLSRALVGAVTVNRGLWGTPLGPREIRAEVGCEVVGMIPPGAEAVRSAVQTGLPLVLSRPESNTAAALNELASRLILNPVPAIGP